MYTLDQTLSYLAVSIPGATAIFHPHNLDFCGGGKQTLRAAADKCSLEISAIVSAQGLLCERLNGCGAEVQHG